MSALMMIADIYQPQSDRVMVLCLCFLERRQRNANTNEFLPHVNHHTDGGAQLAAPHPVVIVKLYMKCVDATNFEH